MRIFLGLLSAISLTLAARRFYLSEETGYDIGALFFLLIGVQLLVAAVLVHEHQQSRRSVSSEDKEKGSEPMSEKQGPKLP